MIKTGQRNFAQTANQKALKPETQTKIGIVGGALVLLYCTYYIISHHIYMIVKVGIPPRFLSPLLVSFTFGYVIPITYLCGIRAKNLVIAKVAYRIWLIFVLGFFLFVGLRKLVLNGNFSDFSSFWAPLGIVTIFWWVGVRGLTRIVEPGTGKTSVDTVSDILMYIGIFLGFFCGGKITHDFLASYWPDVLHYEIQWVLPCLGGGIAGSLVGAFIGAFVGFFIDQPQKGKKIKEHKT